MIESSNENNEEKTTEGRITEGRATEAIIKNDNIDTSKVDLLQGKVTEGIETDKEKSFCELVELRGVKVEGTKKGIYIIEEFLSKSGEADIYKCKKEGEEDKIYVLKLYSDRTNFDKEKRNNIIEFLSKKHEYVISLVDYGIYKNRSFDIYPYYKQGSINNIKKQGQEEKIEFLKNIVIPQLNKGLKEIHKENIIHRDIKPENIFISDYKEKIIIGDFGISSIVIQNKKGRVTKTDTKTPGYTPPEAYNRLIGNYTDYYAMGIVLLEILKGFDIFSGYSDEQIFKATITGEIPYLNKEKFENVISNSNDIDKIEGLIVGLTLDNYKERWDFEKVEKWCENKIELPIIVRDNVVIFSKTMRFNNVEAKDLKTLGNALTKRWYTSKEQIYRHNIAKFLEEEAYFDLSGKLDDIINDTDSFLTINAKLNDKKDIGTFKTIYLINEEEDKIYWKEKCYNDITEFVNDIPNDESIADNFLNGNISWLLKNNRNFGYISEDTVTKITQIEENMKINIEKNNYLKAKEELYKLYYMFQTDINIDTCIEEEIEKMVYMLKESGKEIYNILGAMILRPSFRAMVWKSGKENVFEQYDNMQKNNKYLNVTEGLKVLEALTSKKESIRDLALKYGVHSEIIWLKNNLNLYYMPDILNINEIKDEINKIEIKDNTIAEISNKLLAKMQIFNKLKKRMYLNVISNIDTEKVDEDEEKREKIIPLKEEARFLELYELPIGYLQAVEDFARIEYLVNSTK